MSVQIVVKFWIAVELWILLDIWILMELSQGLDHSGAVTKSLWSYWLLSMTDTVKTSHLGGRITFHS